MNEMCRNSEIFVKLTILYNYSSLFCSKIMKKYEILAIMSNVATFEFGFSVLRHAVIYETHPFFVIIDF